ncbi:hypothetical protein ACFW04_011185 [Cataglyphis niger]
MERALSTTTRRRGHQHHPRHTTRRRLDASSRGPAQCGPAGAVKDTNDDETSLAGVIVDCRLGATEPPVSRVTLDTRWPTRISETETRTQIDENDRRVDDVRQRLAQCSLDVPALAESKNACERRDETTSKKECSRSGPEEEKAPDDRESDPRSKSNSPEPEHAVARARGDGNSDDESANVEEDPELAELAKLRCPSERAEVQAEREARRRKRCADYPGLAFGCSIFSSDTMMKFSLIKNELQNIMGNQLKRRFSGSRAITRIQRKRSEIEKNFNIKHLIITEIEKSQNKNISRLQYRTYGDSLSHSASKNQYLGNVSTLFLKLPSYIFQGIPLTTRPVIRGQKLQLEFYVLITPLCEGI